MGLLPITQNINNNRTSLQNGMPLKDNVSDGTSNFSLVRRRYAKTPNFMQLSSMTSKETKTKKWYGNSQVRDSTHSRMRGLNNESVGLVSKNADKQSMSFTSNTSRNDVQQARRRVLSGGSVVPAKSRFRNHYGEKNIFQ